MKIIFENVIFNSQVKNKIKLSHVINQISSENKKKQIIFFFFSSLEL